MDTIDIILLGGLCCVISAGCLFRKQRIVRLLVVFILFCISFGSVMSLSTFGPRLAIGQHDRQSGQSSKEFVEGVSLATKIAGLYYPYVLLSTVGLALMAVLSQKKGRDDA
ncbi:MAG: hypothetical protein HY043_17805 [Verrucomicrobia bacterium]|nr:hypothetical protein [Verrucomicrobiota bacterium]